MWMSFAWEVVLREVRILLLARLVVFFSLGSAAGFLSPRMLWTPFVASSPEVVL
jgi:hypothetical protein